MCVCASSALLYIVHHVMQLSAWTQTASTCLSVQACEITPCTALHDSYGAVPGLSTIACESWVFCGAGHGPLHFEWVIACCSAVSYCNSQAVMCPVKHRRCSVGLSNLEEVHTGQCKQLPRQLGTSVTACNLMDHSQIDLPNTP